MTKYKRFIVASDVHGDQLDPEANRVLFKFIERWKPEIRIMAGDLWDFRPLRGKATDDEKRESMKADYEAGMEWLEEFQPHHFLRGNHDERLWELAAHGDGVRADYANQVIDEITKNLAKMNCRMLPYHKRDGILRIGSLKVIHGFHAGMHAVKQSALIYGACLMGHVHTIDECSIPGLERRTARAIGCLCSLDMDYNSRVPSSLRHAHGFAFGVINQKTGDYHVFQAESVNNEWVIPSDVIIL